MVLVQYDDLYTTFYVKMHNLFSGMFNMSYFFMLEIGPKSIQDWPGPLSHPIFTPNPTLDQHHNPRAGMYHR